MMKFYKQRACTLFLQTTIGLLGLVSLSPAHALPPEQVSCSNDIIDVAGFGIPDNQLRVSVNTPEREVCILKYSTNVYPPKTGNSEMLLKYSIDGGPCSVGGDTGTSTFFDGPDFLTLSTAPSPGNSTLINRLFLAQEGHHTIQPCYDVSQQKIATIGERCLTVECETDESECPTDMMQVGPICVDKFEAQVVDSNNIPQGTNLNFFQFPCSPNGNNCSDPQQPEKMIFARSRRGVAPTELITWFQAQQACINVGKRLLTNAEWQAAAAGTPDAEPCNMTGGNQMQTGTSGCESNFGIFDMVGNVGEWVADWIQDNSDRDRAFESTALYGNDRIIGVDEAFFEEDAFPAAIIRGGTTQGSSAGVFALNAEFGPSFRLPGIGFRCAR